MARGPLLEEASMRFRVQLVIGHTALLFTNALACAVALVALHSTTTRLEAVTRDLATDMLTIERLRFQAEQLVATSRGYLLTGDSSTWSRFDDAARSVDTSLAQLRHRPDLALDVDRIEIAARSYVLAARTAAERRTTAGDPAAILPFFEQTLTPARDVFEHAITAFVGREQDDFEHETQGAREFAGRAEGLLTATTALGMLLGIALAWVSMHKLNAHYAREREATAVARRAAAARDDLLAIVSHDLRTPLTTIAMGTTLLDETISAPLTRKHIAAISNAASRMQHLIDELLDAAKLESGTFELQVEPCDTTSLLESTSSLFQARAIEARIELAVEPRTDCLVLADREGILRVLSNLVANALKFTPPGGRISVGTRATDGVVRFEVDDTGPGISNEQQPHLFERYWQGRRHARGSVGLGLYICRQLVLAHRGEIGVESRLGEGSAFWFTLPRASVTAGGAARSAT